MLIFERMDHAFWGLPLVSSSSIPTYTFPDRKTFLTKLLYMRSFFDIFFDFATGL